MDQVDIDFSKFINPKPKEPDSELGHSIETVVCTNPELQPKPQNQVESFKTKPNQFERNEMFGSPPNRKQSKRGDQLKTFTTDMKSIGLTKDLNILSSFNAFFEKPSSPLRLQRSLDIGHQPKHSSLANKLLGHHKNITVGNVQSPDQTAIIKKGVPDLTRTRNLVEEQPGSTGAGSYSFPFQRRARSASPPQKVKDVIQHAPSPKNSNVLGEEGTRINKLA